MTRYPEVFSWPMAEALLAYEHKLKEQARHDWELAVMQWVTFAAAGATKQRKPPEPPDILKLG